MNLLFLTLVFPLLGFLLLAFSRGRWSERTSALVGVGSVGLSALVSAWITWLFSTGALQDGAYIQILWQWMAVRSEERRVGKECRSGWWREHLKKKKER